MQELATRAASAVVVTREVLPEVVALVRHFAGAGADQAAVAAALTKVRGDVPGPFEPAWPGTDGAGGSAEFRRRYGDAGEKSPAEKVADERLTRDRAQVRGLLISKGVRV